LAGDRAAAAEARQSTRRRQARLEQKSASPNSFRFVARQSRFTDEMAQFVARTLARQSVGAETIGIIGDRIAGKPENQGRMAIDNNAIEYFYLLLGESSRINRTLYADAAFSLPQLVVHIVHI
jgi:hypothetical protein